MSNSSISEMKKDLSLEDQDQIADETKIENYELDRAIKMECDEICIPAMIQFLYFRCGINAYLYDKKDRPNEYYDVETRQPYTHEQVLEMIRTGRRNKD